MSRYISKKISEQQQVDTNVISSIFELEIHADIFFSRCQDTGEKPDLEKAKMFKESLNKVNSKKNPHVLNLNSMRIGVNTIMKLIHILETHRFTELNLADNSISEYGMHAIKNLIGSTHVQNLNLASNMISEVGLSLILEEFIKNTHIRKINLGIEEGSIRKNSFGIDGARCLAAILLQNKALEVLLLEDNDIGINGAQILSIPLKKNKHLKELKISENLIKTQGAEYILLNALNLTSLDLGKNFIKSSIGPALKKYLQTNKNLRSINLQYNELMAEGAQVFFEGAIQSQLQEINLRGNSIGDRGLAMIEQVILYSDRKLSFLEVLNLSTNDITRDGVKHLISIVNSCKLKVLNLSKNLLSDDGIIDLVNNLKMVQGGQLLERLDIGGCKISDKGFMFLIENVENLKELRYLKVNQNYISEKYQKIYAQMLQKNFTLIVLNLHGNRLSLSGLKAIKKVIDRNMKSFEEREPNRLKSEIINLKEKQKKIKETLEKIQKQKKEILELQKNKARLNDNIARLQKQERDRTRQHDNLIKKKKDLLSANSLSVDNKMETLEKMKLEKTLNIEKMTKELSELRQKRKHLEYELTVAENQGEQLEKQFEKKIKKVK